MVDPDPVRRARHSEEAAVDSFGASDETATASESEPTACDQGVTRAACSAKLACGRPGNQPIHGGLAERRECPIQPCCLAGIPVDPFGELGGGCASFSGDEDSLSLKQRRSRVIRPKPFVIGLIIGYQKQNCHVLSRVPKALLGPRDNKDNH